MRRGKAITTGSTARSSVPDAAREVLELFPSGNCISGSQQVGNNDPRDDYMVSSTRTSIKQIYDVISSLDEFKRELVKSIGFGGMLLFPSLRQINRRFAVWLMSRVDPLTQTLVIDSKKKIKFGKTDVERVFGIPCSGSIISETGMARRDIISKVTTVYLGEDSRQSRSIKTAQEVVERKYNNKMTEAEQAAFKVAFVIYIMSTLLSPGSKYNYVSVDYWSALVEPCSIGKFDWSEYVIRKLFQAVVKLKTELQASNRVSNITGCSIFLQVLYLDSIDVGVMNMEHSTFPRISSFSAETIKSMVLADSLCRSGGSSDFEFGKSQLRNASGICYSWAYESFSACCGGIGSSLPGLWEISVSFSRALGVHMKAAGALFFAVAEFEMMSSRHEANHAGSIASVLTKIIEPFTNGYCYDAGRDINMAWLGTTIGADVSRMLDEASLFVCCNWQRRGFAFEDGSSEHNDATGSASIQDCNCRKRPRGPNSLTISGQTSEERFTHTSATNGYICIELYGPTDECDRVTSYETFKKALAIRALARYYISLCCMNRRNCLHKTCITCQQCNHHHLNNSGFREESAASTRNASTQSNYTPQCPVILHYTPKHIEVPYNSFQTQLTGRSEIVMDMFDAIIRRFTEVTKSGGECVEGYIQRHIFESIFIGTLLAGTFNATSQVIKDQISALHIEYELPSCRILFFPGIVGHRWVTYAWCLDRNIISVFDPFFNENCIEEHKDVHIYVIGLIKNAMKLTASHLITGWNYNWEAARIEIIGTQFAGSTWNRSTGCAAAQFCFHYNGTLSSLSRVNVADASKVAEMLTDALGLKENQGFVPTT